MKYLIIAMVVLTAILLLIDILKPRPKTVGCIRINTSDPEKDIYSLELAVPFGELDVQKKVIFTIEKD